MLPTGAILIPPRRVYPSRQRHMLLKIRPNLALGISHAICLSPSFVGRI